ncbi:MAG: chemotaxis protein CheB, partial [Saprospiraceae bacterium]
FQLKMTTPKKSKPNTPAATVQNFPIVGIGASAGGLEAFKRLLKVIPGDSGMAYVLVQHLDPTHESMLPEILSRVTKIPVYEITDDIHLAPDHIYILPANKMLSSTDGVLKLTTREKKIQNKAIDVFFTSLAEVHTSFAVGVVLSGTGADGTLGLKAIKAHRGITIAQDPESAAYPAMPQSAIDAGVVDFILALENIPAQLLEINDIDHSSEAVAKKEPEAKDDETYFKQILSLIHLRSGVDFTYYKQPTPRRRIARRMAMSKIVKLSAYLKYLRANKSEQDALFQDMLIPVTSFFRDTRTFLEITGSVIPLLVKNKHDGDPIRVWVVGCSTGEEAYSIAIALHEYLSTSSRSMGLNGMRIQIFASDISEASIKKARVAIYSKTELQGISETRLRNYFVKNNGAFEVAKFIRNMCVFAPHNFLKDPPFAKMDLISCRNVLIYMDSFLQKKALATFHYALNENGILILGKSESTGHSSDAFEILSKTEKIYLRKPMPGRFMHVASERKEESLVTKTNKRQKVEIKQTDFRKSAEAMMLSNFTPPGVIVNEAMDIVHIHGSISPYLEQLPGKPTFNLLKMARQGLSFELRNAMHKAKTGQTNVIKEGIPITMHGKQSLVGIEIIPLTNTVDPYFLVLFNKTLSPVDEISKENNGSSVVQKIKQDSLLRVTQLETELAQNREDMRAITEDQEAANEELQSANEELLSSSEEMQSLNEELETSKEELQSTNEELLIVNQELLDKQEQLNASNVYSEAIISTIREPLVVLDRSLRIRTANAAFYTKFQVVEEDTEDKLFYEIQDHKFDDHALRSLLEKILPQQKQIEDYEIRLNFPSIGERAILINAAQIINEKPSELLILLALEDITERKAEQKKLESFNEQLEALVKERTLELEQSNIQLQQFAYIASHDLQEPLRKIITFSNILSEKHKAELSTPAKSILNRISTSSQRMSQLIQDVLNYSRLINHDKLFTQTDLNEILKNVLDDFELLIEQKDAVIKAETLPVICAVPLQMNQLFYNLISNSLKFSKEDFPPVINIICRELAEKDFKKFPSLMT